MSSPGYLGLVIILCLLAVFYLRLKCLYVLFIGAFIQNTALPFIYTSFGASRGLVASLLVSKEVLLSVLFLWCIYVWKKEVRQPWPKPVVILFLFTCYCSVRIAISLASGDDPTQCFRKLRLVWLPLLFLIVAITAAYTQPEFAKKFLRQMTYLLVALALIGILMWILPPNDFWVSHANIATYGIEIKGDEPFQYEEAEGIMHTSGGREEFLLLAPFRAFGTFGDPLAMGFALSSPVLILAFVYRKRWFTWPLVLILAVALFATFDRSAWIFVFVVCAFIWYRRRRYKWLLALALAPVIALLTIPPLAEFAQYETRDLSWSHPEPEGHAGSIVYLYQHGFTDPRNLFGKGMRTEVEIMGESGYGWLLEHFGMPAFLLWVWFLISMYRHMKLRDSGTEQIPLLSEGLIVATFVVMHFSYYPFSFIGWIPIWYFFGIAVACPRVGIVVPGRSIESGAIASRKPLPEGGGYSDGNFGGAPQPS
jgi:hypothetical protein